jgi:hypothetical protein
MRFYPLVPREGDRRLLPPRAKPVTSLGNLSDVPPHGNLGYEHWMQRKERKVKPGIAAIFGLVRLRV